MIRPENKIEVGRTESNTEKLEALYEEGYALAERLVGAAITAAANILLFLTFFV